MKRENDKTVEIMGRTFKIKKFDAYTGSYILFQLMERVIPMGMENKIDTGTAATLGENLPAGRTLMTKKEFLSFQKDCLSVVGEVLPARTAPILNENGSWGVEDIKDNTLLVVLLTIHALAFNVADFFGGDGLKELKSSITGIFPVSIKI